MCMRVERVAQRHNFHTALTGGTLYKIGVRKDVDIVLYRRGGTYPGISERAAVLRDLQRIGFRILPEHDYGYVVKAKYRRESVDILFPHVFDVYVPE